MKAYEYAQKWYEEYKNYRKTLLKYNVSIADIAQMQEAIDEGKYKVECEHSKYTKVGSRWVATESKTTEIDGVNYLNIVISIPMFNDRVRYTCTKYGRIPDTFSCVSWGTGTEKAVRRLKFIQL